MIKTFSCAFDVQTPCKQWLSNGGQLNLHKARRTICSLLAHWQTSYIGHKNIPTQRPCKLLGRISRQKTFVTIVCLICEKVQPSHTIKRHHTLYLSEQQPTVHKYYMKKTEKYIFPSLPFKRGHSGHVAVAYAVEFAADWAHKSEAQHQSHQAWGE